MGLEELKRYISENYSDLFESLAYVDSLLDQCAISMEVWLQARNWVYEYF